MRNASGLTFTSLNVGYPHVTQHFPTNGFFFRRAMMMMMIMMMMMKAMMMMMMMLIMLMMMMMTPWVAGFTWRS
jgi:hypothetical protein